MTHEQRKQYERGYRQAIRDAADKLRQLRENAQADCDGVIDFRMGVGQATVKALRIAERAVKSVKPESKPSQ